MNAWPPPEAVTLPAVDAPELDDQVDGRGWWKRYAVDIVWERAGRTILLIFVSLIVVFGLSGGVGWWLGW